MEHLRLPRFRRANRKSIEFPICEQSDRRGAGLPLPCVRGPKSAAPAAGGCVVRRMLTRRGRRAAGVGEHGEWLVGRREGRRRATTDVRSRCGGCDTAALLGHGIVRSSRHATRGRESRPGTRSGDRSGVRTKKRRCAAGDWNAGRSPNCRWPAVKLCAAPQPGSFVGRGCRCSSIRRRARGRTAEALMGLMMEVVIVGGRGVLVSAAGGTARELRPEAYRSCSPRPLVGRSERARNVTARRRGGRDWGLRRVSRDPPALSQRQSVKSARQHPSPASQCSPPSLRRGSGATTSSRPPCMLLARPPDVAYPQLCPPPPARPGNGLSLQRCRPAMGASQRPAEPSQRSPTAVAKCLLSIAFTPCVAHPEPRTRVAKSGDRT